MALSIPALRALINGALRPFFEASPGRFRTRILISFTLNSLLPIRRHFFTLGHLHLRFI